MAVRLLSSIRKSKISLSHWFASVSPSYSEAPLPDLVNDVSRILSDHRSPHHDLELRLDDVSSKISTSLVEQVLKRCNNIGFAAYRFFLWARERPGFEPSTESYRIVVDILGSTQNFALLWDLLIEMRDTKCCPIEPGIFWVVFKAYCRAKLPGDAVRAFRRMVEFGIKPGIDDLDQLLYTLCKRKHVNEAHRFFGDVKNQFDPNAKTYSILIRGWGDAGMVEGARNLFDEMLERGCLLDVVAYNSLLEALCKGGMVEEAYEMLRGMGSKGMEPDACTYSIFIRAYCEANDIHLAFMVLDRMRRYDLVPNVFTYNCLIKKLCKNEKVEEAYNLLDEMILRGIRPDTWSYNAILAFHCEHSEVNRTLRLIQKMERENCSPDRHTYNMVLKLLIRVGRFDVMERIWNGMGEKGFYPSVSTFSVMVHGFCKKKGKVDEACKYFEMMVDEGIPPYSSTVELLRNRLMGLGFLDQIDILSEKMAQSTSCSIQELANMMRGKRVYGSSRTRDRDVETESDMEM